jgi:hypothetical protein
MVAISSLTQYIQGVCDAGCSVVGTSAGAVDLKTHCKWVWAYVEAIAKLVDMVVSLLYFFAFVY